MNYTKREWKVSCRKNVYGDECYAINSGDEMIAIVSGFGHKANAQLIASAPKMAKLLGLYLADCQLEHLEYNDDTYKLAIEIGKQLGMPEALAKAEGK